jgi:thiosulfate dehydrogenase
MAGRLLSRRGPLASVCVLAALACGRSPTPDKHPGPPPHAAARDSAPVALRAPSDSEIPDGPLGVSIRRGRALLIATRDSLPRYVGNQLRCVSCHLDNGLRANSSPWIGVYGRFPQYRSRSGTVQVLEDRINDCFQRSMDGRALPFAGREMRDMVAYFAFLSRGVPVGRDVPGQGFAKMTPLPADTARGAQVFAESCARCHGANGEGTAAAPPVWGKGSYNIGAGMARVRTAASFIRYNMPFDKPGSLTDQQAFDVAAYINGRPRPDFRGKEKDWPNGDPPSDVAYHTLAGVKRGGTPSQPGSKP